jgi:hypothetical protein
VLAAIARLRREAPARGAEAPACRYWVTGRAGLPAFFHLGYRLSKIAAVTFVHQARNGGAVEVMPLDDQRVTSAAPFFDRTPWPVPRSQAPTPAALVVSSRRRPPTQQIHDAMAERRVRTESIVRAYSPADLDTSTARVAMRELEQTVRETCDAHPGRSTLAVFIAGPSSLAFLAGGAINPRACRDVQVFEFDGQRYVLAYELPYPAVPERNLALLFLSQPAGLGRLALDEEIRAIQLEQGSGKVADRLEIAAIPAARPKDVFDQLRTREPGVVHFSGHGETGELLFQDDGGALRPVSTDELAESFRLAGRSVRVVVLSACHSESLAEALIPHVGCVVAMRGPILDDDARRFAAAFYHHLAEGDSVRDTFDKALLAMRLARPAWAATGRARDVEDSASVGAVEGAGDEPPQLHERDPGCARELFLVRRRR